MLSVRISRKFSTKLGFLQVLALLLALLSFALTVAATAESTSSASPFVTDSVSSAMTSSSDLQSNAPLTLAETTTIRPATPPSSPSSPSSPSVNQPARGRPPVSGADSAPGQVSYHYKTINGLSIFYRQAGLPTSPTLLLLHGFPTSSHQYRELIPLLSRDFFIIAPDYPGFGNSDSPLVTQFNYTFDSLAASVTQLIVELGLPARGGITFYVQDYGAPVGFRIITAHPEWVENIVIQNGNIYPNGLGSGFGPVFNYWAAPSPATEAPLRALTTAPLVKFQFVNGVTNPDLISPDAYLHPLISLARPGNDLVQLKLLFDYQYNLPLYPSWVQYMRTYRPRTLVVWGLNDIFFVFPSSLPADNPNARLVSYNTGHFALEEARYDIATRIRRFAGRDRDD